MCRQEANRLNRGRPARSLGLRVRVAQAHLEPSGVTGKRPDATLTNPQSLNLYVYVRDNPTTLTDPDGHAAWPGEIASFFHDLARSMTNLSCTGQNLPANDQTNDPGAKAKQQNASQVDKDKFVNYMDQHAKNKSTGYCAMACRKGLAAGGLDTTGHPAVAKDYGPFLTKHGASVVPNKAYKPQKGDIVVFGGNKSHPYGHIEVYNGKGWVSDFKQHSMIPYRSDMPPHTIYRFPDDQ